MGRTVDGRYRVDSVVARGGMATVFRATDTRLDRVVALKVMHANLADDPEFVQRFVREAKLAARVNHPAIVSVFDQGESDGLVYLVMEYIPGRTLRAELRQEGRLSAQRALTVVTTVLDALQAAHQAGLAHRDIKPENVLLSDSGTVKVADFGLARAIAESNASAVTRGLLIGTVAYLAPEQVEQGHADQRSDVYSAGIVLYEACVGQVPFTGETPLSIAYQHVHGTVPAPSSIRADVPHQIDQVVARATARDPQNRYASAGEFATAVRALAAELPAQPDGRAHTVVLDRDERTITVGPRPTAAMPVEENPIAAGSATATLTPAPPEQIPPVDELRVTTTNDDGSNWQPPASGAPAAKSAPRRPRKFRVLIAFLLLLALAIGTGIGVRVYTQAQLVTVPKLVGMSPTDANKQLAADQLSVDVTGSDFSDSVDKGLILSSSVSAGAKAHKGDSIGVITSAGPENVPVPKVAGKSLAAAKKALAKVGLTATVSEDWSSSTDIGDVISSSPTKGTKTRVGSSVELLISKGPPPVTVPDVTSMGKDAAVTTLQNLGLVVEVKPRLGVVVLNRVYSQTPSAGTTVKQGTTVVITLV